MNTKELTVLGKALKALLKAGMIDDVKEIVDYMASDKEAVKDNRKEKE
ncbi:MAG: hypothetical protein LBS19_07040 [Clostridiales bacterium]|jgi:pentatricopeptide repeat protein|nr:hypothetical protein [Clostridiales bacterium]